METITIHHKGTVTETTADAWKETLDQLVSELGAWEPGVSRIERRETIEPPTAVATPVNSTWEKQIIDEAAKTRIEGLHDKLRANGVNIDTDRQLYATGTRMADIGYANQARRKAAFDAASPLRDVAAQLSQIVRDEKRRDVIVTAGELAQRLEINGALKFDGMQLREQAVRGIIGRLKSPALSYVLGLRDRLRGTVDDDGKTVPPTAEHKAMDKTQLLAVMQHELRRYADVKLRLRLRDGLGDVFAAMSPEYAAADAPEVLADVLAALPADARALFTYDAVTTAWQIKANVFTPTPVDMQAVGEPFEGYVSFGSKDNGTRRLTGGGGFLLLACLNASTYEAETATVSRRHVGKIMVDLRTMVQDATAAIHTLCEAWGSAREDVLKRPNDDAGVLIPIETAIPGFYRHMLTARKGELVGVLPGRTKAHVEGLTAAYFDQARDGSKIVRADLAQGFTRYIQDQPAAVRIDAEAAIGKWMVGGEKVSFAAA